MTDSTPPVPPVPPPVPPVPPAAPAAAVPPAPNPYAVDPSAPNPYAQPNAYAQPNSYAAAPYGSGQYAPATNTLAIVALVLAFVVPLGGIICGHIALNQIKRTGERGHGLALAGTVLGYVFVGLSILIFIIYIVIFAVAAASGGFSSYSG